MDSTRRAVIQLVSGALAALALPCAARARGLFPDSSMGAAGGGAMPDPGASASVFAGCSISGSAASGHFSPDKLVRRINNPRMNYLMNAETTLLAMAFGDLSPAFSFFDDTASPNALATPAKLISPMSDGTVLFGVTLLGKEVTALPHPAWHEPALLAVMAHEWGHIAQFSRAGGVRTGKAPELHADFMAGWYIGRKFQEGVRGDVRPAARSLFEKGDFSFSSPIHHGTPQERMQAFVHGLQAPYQGARSFDAAFVTGARVIGLSG